MNLNGEFDNVDDNPDNTNIVTDENKIGIDNPDFNSIVTELAVDDANIVAIESALMDIGYLREDILKSGGMSQSFALEADRILNGFINEDLPIGYFTKQPSATKLRYALEEMDKKQMGMIAAAIAAAIAILYKIIKWFTNKDGGSVTAGTSRSDAKEQIKEREELTGELKDGVKEINSNAPSNMNLDRLIKDHADNNPDSKSSTFMYEVDGLTYDLVSSKSRIIDYIVDVLKHNDFERYFEEAKRVINSIYNVHGDKIISEVMGATAEDSVKVQRKLDLIENDFHPSQITQFLTLRFNGKEESIEKVCDDFLNLRDGLLNTTNKIHSPTAAIENYYKNTVEEDMSTIFLKNIYGYKDALETLQKDIGIIEKNISINKYETEEAGYTDHTNPYNERKKILDLIRTYGLAYRKMGTLVSAIENIYVNKINNLMNIFRSIAIEAEKQLKLTIEELENSGSSKSDEEKIVELKAYLILYEDKISFIFKRKKSNKQKTILGPIIHLGGKQS